MEKKTKKDSYKSPYPKDDLPLYLFNTALRDPLRLIDYKNIYELYDEYEELKKLGFDNEAVIKLEQIRKIWPNITDAGKDKTKKNSTERTADENMFEDIRRRNFELNKVSFSLKNFEIQHDGIQKFEISDANKEAVGNFFLTILKTGNKLNFSYKLFCALGKEVSKEELAVALILLGHGFTEDETINLIKIVRNKKNITSAYRTEPLRLNRLLEEILNLDKLSNLKKEKKEKEKSYWTHLETQLGYINAFWNVLKYTGCFKKESKHGQNYYSIDNTSEEKLQIFIDMDEQLLKTELDDGVLSSSIEQIKQYRYEAKAEEIFDKKSYIKTRVGHDVYARKVANLWNNKCAITGISLRSLLISSHIKARAICEDNEKNDPNNGILLESRFDTLFDKYLISFKDNGELIYSKILTQEIKNKLGLNQTLKISKQMSEGMLNYLKHHRSIFEEKESKR